VQPSNSFDIERLYRDYGSALLLFAHSIIRERALAQDVVHKVFLKLIQDDGPRQLNDVKAYLFGCVRNAALNDSSVRRRDVQLEEETAWFEPPNQDHAAEQNLRRALDGLA